MKQKFLAIAGCIVATASTAGLADVLPENHLGLNLGEISASSFINQPFKGVIPFLFSSYEDSKNINVRLASVSVFDKVGAEKHPILNSLNFQITRQNNKPVILISSNKPINMPFLNFILEIQDADNIVYQDYTVLLDPQSKQQTNVTEVDYIDVNQSVTGDNYKASFLNDNFVDNETAAPTSEELLRESGSLLLASASSTTLTSNSQSLSYKVKAGDSLSKIAQNKNYQNVSLKTISSLIYQKNPKAFIRGDVDRIKKGAILSLPTAAEINGFQIAQNKVNNLKTTTISETKVVQEEELPTVDKVDITSAQSTYTVLKGDSLSKITKNFATKDISFTKMMNAIYNNNQNAFLNKSKNKLQAGVTLIIPVIADIQLVSKPKTVSHKVPKALNDTQKHINTVAATSEKSELLTNSQPTLKTTKEIKIQPNQYLIKSGDTLSYITKNIGYKEVPFAKMLKAIYVNNPDAFIDGKMANLSVGSVITLPPLSTMKINPINVAQVSNVVSLQPIKTVTQKSKANDVIPTDLTKRIRELRKELQNAKQNLSDLKSNLYNKETLLKQKNIQLDSLNTLLTKFDKGINPEVLPAVAVKTKVINSNIEKSTYKPKSKAEFAKLQRDLLIKKQKTNKQQQKIGELKSKTLESHKSLNMKDKDSVFKEYQVSSLINASNTNYYYLTMALALGLLLIRYRRKLYTYTYSAIKFDQPQYYPVPDANKFDLKEKNISFYDRKMDENPNHYENLTQEITQNEEIVINPLLVETKKELFKDKEIANCEHLISELFDDLDAGKNVTTEADAEWKNIEKVCDTYIEKIKAADIKSETNKDGELINGVTDFNHMMSDLIESLGKVDNSVKNNNIRDEDFPDIVINSDHKLNDNNQNIGSRSVG